MINLYPYNAYILAGAGVILVTALIVTMVYAVKLLKQLKAEMTTVRSIAQNTKTTTVKLAALKKKQAEKKKRNRLILTIAALVLAFHQAYKKEEENGIKGCRKAAVKTITRYNNKKKKSEWQKFARNFIKAVS